MSFVFDQIDAIERERLQKDDTLQRIRAWRQSKNTAQQQQQNPETITSHNPEILSSRNEGLESGFRDNDDSSLNMNESNSVLLMKKTEMEVVHPWPEWIELMERLVHQNYFDHRRRDEDKMVQDMGFDPHYAGNDDYTGIDFKDFKTVQTACVNFGKDRFDIFRFVVYIFGLALVFGDLLAVMNRFHHSILLWMWSWSTGGRCVPMMECL